LIQVEQKRGEALLERRISDVQCDRQEVLDNSGLRGLLDFSGLYPPSERASVSKRIKAKREELVKRRDMLVEVNKLLEDQRDDASEADMLLHAERYDDLTSRHQPVLTPN